MYLFLILFLTKKALDFFNESVFRTTDSAHHYIVSFIKEVLHISFNQKQISIPGLSYVQ